MFMNRGGHEEYAVIQYRDLFHNEDSVNTKKSIFQYFVKSVKRLPTMIIAEEHLTNVLYCENVFILSSFLQGFVTKCL